MATDLLMISQGGGRELAWITNNFTLLNVTVATVIANNTIMGIDLLGF